MAQCHRWRSIFVASCFMSTLSSSPLMAHEAADIAASETIVTMQVEKSRAAIQQLIGAGYDIAGFNLKKGTVDVITRSDEQMTSLQTLGLRILKTTKIDVTMAPDSNYKNPDEVSTILHQYATDFPNIARLSSIGKSIQGRDIWAMKISDNPDTRELDEPTILFNGMHHAREVMSVEVPLDTIEHLLTLYGSDAEITKWIDSNEIWVVPMVNPDGNNLVWNQNSMWRKNARNGYGVDINRNYPYAWGTCNGSSGSTSSDTYRGASAASEPETQALMGLVARVQPVFDISYHSYSELVIYPYGCNGARTETKEVVEPLGREVANKLPSENGGGNYDPGTAWELLYAVDGSDIDWMYHEHHVVPYVIELNSDSSGFQPPYRMRQPTVEKLRAAWKLLIAKLDGPSVRGVVRDGAGRTLPGTKVTVQALGEKGGVPYTWSVKDDGTYHLVLRPGMYKLKFEFTGRMVEKSVVIGQERTNLDIEL